MFETFIREMRARGYERFFMPGYQAKKDAYPGVSPPAYLYNDVPRAMRFRSMPFANISGRPEFKEKELVVEIVGAWAVTVGANADYYAQFSINSQPWWIKYTAEYDEAHDIQPGMSGIEREGLFAIPFDAIPKSIKEMMLARAKAVHNKKFGGTARIDPDAYIFVLASTTPKALDDLASRVTDFDAELQVGIKEEMEHTRDPKIAERIAMDHLTEDPKYYTKLKQCMAAKQHRGVMIAVYPAIDVCEKLAVDGGEEPKDMHVTLAYLGKLDVLPEDVVEKCVAAVSSVAAKHPTLSGEIGGIGCFAAGEDKKVVHATVDVPGLAELRVACCEALKEAGIPAKDDHGFDPHLTIQYVSSDAQVTIKGIEPLSVDFDTVWIVSGDTERHPVKLGTDHAQASLLERFADQLDVMVKRTYGPTSSYTNSAGPKPIP